MIYINNFENYLRENLGDPVIVKPKNIICRCPWCELNAKKKHYHLYISTMAPIFHCFHVNCEVKGTIDKLIMKISGIDKTEIYVDKEKIKEQNKKINILGKKQQIKDLYIPPLNPDKHKLKTFYIKKRFKHFNIDVNEVKGLVFSIKTFIRENNIVLSNNFERIIDYLDSNFIGFVTEHQSVLYLRNIDENSDFKHHKIYINEVFLTDYYKIQNNINGKYVVLGEGIFDIYTEYLFDYLKIKQDVILYASALKGSYQGLIKSLVFYEQLFRLNCVIISDRDVLLDSYEKLKMYNNHIINNMVVYYNKTGKDFNNTPVIPEMFKILHGRR